MQTAKRGKDASGGSPSTRRDNVKGFLNGAQLCLPGHGNDDWRLRQGLQSAGSPRTFISPMTHHLNAIHHPR